jgi:predicted DNA-binding transcriptional regulator AlpA
MVEILEQVKQEQEKKRRALQQLEAKRPNRGQRARRCSKRPEKPNQQHKDGDEEPFAKPPLVFLSKKEVLAKIPVAGPTLWAWSRTGKFPRPYALGPRTVWLASEVDDWMRTRPLRNYKGAEVA